MSTYNPAYGAKYHRDRRLGLPSRLIPIGDIALENIAGYAAEGFNIATIARAAGVTQSAVDSALEHRYAHMRRSTRTKLAGVTRADLYESAGPRDWVPRIGFDRRYQALMAIGHTSRDLYARGVYKRYHGSVIWRSTWDNMRVLYDDLWDQPGSSDLTRGRAAARKWAPPLAWDDDTIDDPNARPSPFLLSSGAVRAPGAFVEDAEWLADAGESLQGAARRLGVTPHSLVDMLRQRGRTDLTERFKLAEEREAS